jgi:hypothetical protein
METMAPVTRRVRAYFAPVNRVAKQAAVFDAAQSGGFALDAPPSPWIDLGWISDFARQCATKIEPIRSGAPAVTQMQARTEIDAKVSFCFESWRKLQLALAAGTQQMNLLQVVSGTAAEDSGGTGIAAVVLAEGSTATVLQMATADAAKFSVGQLVAVDIDYTGQTGFVGSGVSGAYVQSALSDVEYIRRITLNVARVAAIAGGAVTLAWPLLAGTPAAAMKVSAVVGYCDREGSSFFQEWSALFVAEGRQGERVVWFYPRLQTMAGIAEASTATGAGFEKLRLNAAFRALPVQDPLDGETVVCFRSYVAG